MALNYSCFFAYLTFLLYSKTIIEFKTSNCNCQHLLSSLNECEKKEITVKVWSCWLDQGIVQSLVLVFLLCVARVVNLQKITNIPAQCWKFILQKYIFNQKYLLQEIAAARVKKSPFNTKCHSELFFAELFICVLHKRGLFNQWKQLLTEANKEDRGVDTAPANVFSRVAWVPRQREKAACSEGDKLQLTVCRSIGRKQSRWESHWSQGHRILKRIKKIHLNLMSKTASTAWLLWLRYSRLLMGQDAVKDFVCSQSTLCVLPEHTKWCLCLTFRGKLLREVLWEPVLQRKRSCCSWMDSDISIPWLTVETSRRWYAVQVIPMKCAVRIKWASITMFLDTYMHEKQLILYAYNVFF